MALNLKEKIAVYLKNIWFLWAACLLVNIITFLFVYFKIHPGNKILALRYNVLAGVEWYGHGTNLYFIPAAALGLTAANFWLFKALKKTADFPHFLTAFVSLCIALILLAAVLFLAKVN